MNNTQRNVLANNDDVDVTEDNNPYIYNKNVKDLDYDDLCSIHCRQKNVRTEIFRILCRLVCIL